jgi:hypothetical protein
MVRPGVRQYPSTAEADAAGGVSVETWMPTGLR